jgi:hypothetical protein
VIDPVLYAVEVGQNDEDTADVVENGYLPKSARGSLRGFFQRAKPQR